MNCPTCGSALSERDIFCKACACQARCRNCRKALEKNAAACVECGWKIKVPTEDGSNASDLSFKVLKPYLSGTLWQVGHPNNETWTIELLRFANHFALELKAAMPLLAQQLAADNRVVTHSYIPPVLCTQRRIGELDKESDDLFLQPDAVLPEDLAKHPFAIYFCGFAYKTKTNTRWTTTSMPGERWDLVQIAFAWPFSLISVTSSNDHERIVSFLNFRTQLRFPGMALLPAKQELLDEAFIGEETQQTNLRGLHRSRKEKPDRKTLYGTDLRHALDPYGDQTFAYTYGRAVLRLQQLNEVLRNNSEIRHVIEEAFPNSRKKKITLGYGQPDRLIILGSTPGLVHFARRLDAIRLLLIETNRRIQQNGGTNESVWGERLGLSYLSGRVTTHELANVSNPFEAQLSIKNREYVDSEDDVADRSRLEEWEQSGSLVPRDVHHNPDSSLSVEVEVRWEGDRLGNLHVIARPEEDHIEMRVKLEVEPTLDGQHIAIAQRLGRLLDDSKKESIELKFESGHILSEGNLYKPTLREVLFTDWEYFPKKLNGRDYDILKEKPDNWAFSKTENIVESIEQSNSLFSLVALNPDRFFNADLQSTDWALLNNDQPEEIADFIFMDSKRRRIDFVHVKKAENDEYTRRISTGPYEEVVPQAIKNLRHVYLAKLRERFDDFMENRNNIGNFCVASLAGKLHITKDTSAALKCFNELASKGQPEIVRVVCFAPHIMKSVWVAQQNTDIVNGPSRSARMLSMILLDAKARAASMNAQFSVWTEEDPGSVSSSATPAAPPSPRPAKRDHSRNRGAKK